jgi:hypothetical protein
LNLPASAGIKAGMAFQSRPFFILPNIQVGKLTFPREIDIFQFRRKPWNILCEERSIRRPIRAREPMMLFLYVEEALSWKKVF